LFEIGEDNPLPALVEAYKAGVWSMDLGISLRAQALQKENPNSKIYQLAGGDVKKITLMTVVKAAEAGDAFAVTLLKDAGARLGRKAAFLVNLFNPEIMIVGGGIEIAGTIFMDSLRETIKQSSVQEATEKIRVIPSALGENGVALGAAALVAQNYFISV
jgi:predicted NBD/HSP70 family sugar kinase